jgi:hypothetical protein
MEDWRAKALESFPALEYEINRNQGGPAGPWNDPHYALTTYENHPLNEDLIGGIYDYAAWCFRQPETADSETLSRAIVVGLIESLPVDQAVSEDLYRWLSIETFEMRKPVQVSPLR